MSSDLSAVAKNVAHSVARGAEKGGKAIVEHYKSIGKNLLKSNALYKDMDADAKKSAEDIGRGAAKDAEHEAEQTGKNAARDAEADGKPPVNGGPRKGDDLDRAGDAPGASRDPGAVCTNGDPVDIATGDVIMSSADVLLPGMLPLVLQRTHRSSWSIGRWLGRSWLSSFDQRLRVTGEHLRGTFDDGRVLTWPLPEGTADPVFPGAGASWPLRRGDDGSYEVTNPQEGLTWRFERPPGSSAGSFDQAEELPLVQVRNRAGHVIEFAYGEAGQPVSVTHSGGYRIDVTTDGEHVTALTLAGTDVPLVSYEYDDAGSLSGVVNSSGQPLRLRYDGDGRLTGWEDRNGRSYRYTYDDVGRCVSGDGPGGALSGTFGYEPGVTRWTDAAGAVTSYEITETALLSAVTDPVGNTTRWEHDDRGRVTQRTDPLGRVTRYAYDNRDNLIALTRPDGSQATAEYDESCQPVVLTEPSGAIWRQEWDERGNRTSLIAPDGGVSRFSYSSSGRESTLTAPDGTVSTIVCNAAGLPTEITGPDGARTRHEINSFGRVSRVIGPDGAVTTLDWTPEGKLASQRNPDGTSEQWEWDGEGNLTRHVSAAGAVTGYEYGPFDTITAERTPDGTRSEFAYDHNLRPTSVTHGGMVWRYEYDPAGRLTSETDYNGAATSYEFDAAGQLIRQVNAAGQEINLDHDVLGNLTRQSADGMVTTFAYDPAGRLTAARNPDADLRLQRDALGRITAETCNGKTVTTSFDAMGRTTGRVTPSGAVTNWEFDQAGRPATMTAGTSQMRFSYDPAGRETRRELPGGISLAQDWDPRGRLTAQVLTGPGGPGDQVLQRRAYTFRPDGFIAGVQDLFTGDRAFGLDQSGRVTTVEGPGWSERYAYDPAGNIAAATWTPTSWPPAEAQGPREISGTRVTRAGSIRYRYDAVGRVVSRSRIRISRKPETWRYQWDADSRLTAVILPDKTEWRYSYDPLGRRIAKQHIDGSGDVLSETRYAWCGFVLAEQAETATPHGTGDGDRDESVTTWEHHPGTFIPLAQTSRSALRDAPQDEIDQRFRAIITDLTGTPAELVAPNGTVVGHQQHTLWGGTVWSADGETTPLRFPGQYEDPETGLHYNNQRYYDPATGSYLSPDPLGLYPALNPYAYVPNPHVLTDPLGLEGECTPVLLKTQKLTDKQMERVSFQYQKFVTGQDYEEIWRHNGREVHLDGGLSPHNYVVEAKWGGGTEAQWKGSALNKYFNKDSVRDQAGRQLALNKALGGKGVRWAVSTEAGASHFREFLKGEFPEEMKNGTLQVLHVPATGMHR